MSTTLTQGIADMQTVIPVMIDIIKQVLDLFMQPPLVFFTAAAFALVGFKIAAFLLLQVKKSA